MNAYIKSVVYLVAFGTTGYVLSELTKPSKETLELLKRQHQGGTSEDTSKKALFMQKLKEASESSEPIYLKKKKE